MVLQGHPIRVAFFISGHVEYHAPGTAPVAHPGHRREKCSPQGSMLDRTP